MHCHRRDRRCPIRGRCLGWIGVRELFRVVVAYSFRLYFVRGLVVFGMVWREWKWFLCLLTNAFDRRKAYGDPLLLWMFCFIVSNR
jgi:hypothetical protein